MQKQMGEVIEVYGPPAFRAGQAVRCRLSVNNDGTFAGCRRGELLVGKGERGYVRDVGTFLQRYYIYAVDFIDRGIVVGMRAAELVADSPREPEQRR